MSKRPRRKQGGKDSFTERYVGHSWEMCLSPAFKCLSPDAVWIFGQLKLQYKYSQGGNSHLILPFADVAWKMKYRRFRAGRDELVRFGFVRIVGPGGDVSHGIRRPIVYALCDEWRRVSRELLADPKAGRVVKRRLPKTVEWPDGDPRNLREEWFPFPKDTARRRIGLERLEMAWAARKEPSLIPNTTTKAKPYKVNPNTAPDPPPPVPKPAPKPGPPPKPKPGEGDGRPVLKPVDKMPLKALKALMGRWRSGESPAVVAAAFRAAGFEPPSVLLGN